MTFLSKIFALDIIGYAVQSNHLHLIMRTRPDLSCAMTDDEVASRWLRLFPPAVFREVPDWTPTQDMVRTVVLNVDRLVLLRKRLTDLSWFMRCLDERIARLANREDQCKGRFWEGRFKSRLLLDEAALLTCLVYVDLNSIRAGEAQTPEQSRFTSAYNRITTCRTTDTITEDTSQGTTLETENSLKDSIMQTSSNWLCPLSDTKARKGAFQSISLKEYLYVLDILGREFHPDKRGAIPLEIKPILHRLSIESDSWLKTLENYDSLFRRILGRAGRVIEQARVKGLRWFQGVKACREVFGT